MVDYIFGWILFAFGVAGRPSVLGEHATDSARQLAELTLMKPKFTVENQEAFQKERAKREANIKRVGEAKLDELEKTFQEKLAARKQTDQISQDVFRAKVNEFQNSEKKKKILNISTKYGAAVTNSLASMQKKLQSMVILLDRITAASGALKTQGIAVSEIEAAVGQAQADVSSALSAVNALTESLPTVLSVNGEDSAKEDVQKALEETKTKIDTVRSVFQKAHTSVGVALSDLETLTNAVEVGLWPEKK